MISCRYLEQCEISVWLPRLFSILHENMSAIAPTGNPYEEDYALWSGAVASALEQENRRIVLIYSDDSLAGYLQYYTNETTLMIEEAQLKGVYQGCGVMRNAFTFLSNRIPRDLPLIEAYANKKNIRSQRLLEHLGFSCIGENRNGNSYRYRGDCQSFFRRLREKQSHTF